MRFKIKIAGIVLAGIIMFLAVLILCISVGAFNRALAKNLSSIANRHMSGTLSIAEIEGNPLSHFYIRKAVIVQNGNAVLEMEELEFDYKPWKLIGKKLQADVLQITGIRIALLEETDSTWNLQNLFLTSTDTPKDTIPHPLPWNIEMAAIRISNVEARVLPKDSLVAIPRSLKFDASLKFAYQQGKTLLDMVQFELVTQHPSLEINHLVFQANFTDSVISWKNFELRLPNSTIYSEGSVPLHELQFSRLSFSAAPLDFKDMAGWMPGIHGNPTIELEISEQDSINKIDFEIIQGNQSLTIKGSLYDVDSTPSYNFLLDADSINGEYWTHEPELKSNIKGQLEVSGKGFDFRKNSMMARAQFDDVKYENYEIKDFLLFMEKNGALLKGNVKANTIFGKVDGEIHLEDIFNFPVYDATIQLSHINLAKLTLNKKLESSINLEIKAKGEGLKPGKINADYSLKSNQSMLFDLPITDFDSRIAIHEEEYNIEGFRIESPYMLAMLSGQGNLPEYNQLQFKLRVKDVEKVAEAFGLEFIQVEGVIDGSLTGPASALAFNSNVELATLCTDSLLLRNVSAHLGSTFSIRLPFTGTESVRWSKIDTANSIRNMYFKTEAALDFASFGKYYMEEIILDLEKEEEALEGRLMSNSLLGLLDSHFIVRNIFSRPNYQINASITGLDLSKIIQDSDYKSDLNLEIDLDGDGIEFESLHANLELRSKGSSIFGWSVDDFNSSLSIDEKNYLLERFHVETPFAVASVTGSGDWNNHNDLAFDLKTKDIVKIPAFTGPGDMAFSAQMNGQLSGTMDSLKIGSELNIQNLTLDTIQLKELLAETEVQILDSTYSGFLKMQLIDARMQDFQLKNLQLTSIFNEKTADNTFTFFANDSLNGSILSEVHFNTDPSLYLKEIDIDYLGDQWKGGGDDSYLIFRKDSIEINDLIFTSEESSVKADGRLAFRGTEDLRLEIQNFKLISIPGLQILPYPVSGTVNANIDIAGTAENPIILGNIDIFEPVVDTIKFSRFYANFGYSNEKLTLESYLNDKLSQLVFADMEVPIHVSFADSISLLKDNTQFHSNIVLDQLYLNRFNGFIPLKGAEADGLLTANIGIENTLNNPLINGNLLLDKGVFKFDKLGVNYNNIELHSHFNNTQFYIDSLHILAGNGDLKLKGSAEMGSLTSGEVSGVSFNLKGQNFKAFDSEMLRAVINTNLDLTGNLAHPVFSGNLTVLRSAFNTDLFLQELSRVQESDQPMLILARNEAESFDFSAETIMDNSPKPPPDIYKNLTGQFDIVIPRNTWAKGKNMNIELAGTLKALKEGEQIDLFGTMQVKRGYYKFYGKRLEFEKGEVILSGGIPFNPTVDFLMAYRFRDPDQMMRKLTVNVSGSILKPSLMFSLDGQTIEEKDAISYLLFNKNTNQLDARENSLVMKNNFDVARDLTMGQLSNVVNDLLQSSLGLDVIEISGKGGWTQGSASVGKYISNNLFLNYERTFSLDKKDKIIEPQKISLEYQIYRSIFLQAINQGTNSGFDFILKWTWK